MVSVDDPLGLICYAVVALLFIFGASMVFGKIFKIIAWKVAKRPFEIGKPLWVVTKPDRIDADKMPDFPKEALSNSGVAVKWEVPDGYAFTMKDGTEGLVQHTCTLLDKTMRKRLGERRLGKTNHIVKVRMAIGWRFVFIFPNQNGKTGLINYNTLDFGVANRTTRQRLDCSSTITNEADRIADTVDAFVKFGWIDTVNGDRGNDLTSPLLFSFEKDYIMLWVTLTEMLEENNVDGAQVVPELARRITGVTYFAEKVSNIIRRPL